jgi:single-strand DNA-binding protein
MNIITIAGNLGRDAEIRYMPDGSPVAAFSVADKQKEHTIWWNCSLFGKRAEALAPYLLKGGAVTVSGTVSEREWKDKDGSPRKSMDVRVSEVALQGGKHSDEPKPAPQPVTKSPIGTKGSGFDDMDDDLIPF